LRSPPLSDDWVLKRKASENKAFLAADPPEIHEKSAQKQAQNPRGDHTSSSVAQPKTECKHFLEKKRKFFKATGLLFLRKPSAADSDFH